MCRDAGLEAHTKPGAVPSTGRRAGRPPSRNGAVSFRPPGARGAARAPRRGPPAATPNHPPPVGPDPPPAPPPTDTRKRPALGAAPRSVRGSAPACRSARSIAAASSAARSYGSVKRSRIAAAQSPRCAHRPRGTRPMRPRSATCASAVHATHSPRPPPSRTSDVGRTPPGYDGTRTAPTRHSTSSTPTGSAASAASAVGGTAEAGDDLPALRQVPVAERVADRDRARRPRAAAQHLVALAEVNLGVLAVGEGDEPRVGREVARRPLPHVADHLVAAEEAPPARVGADGGGCEGPLVQGGVVLAGGHVAPRVTARDAGLQVPRGGLLPLGLGGEPPPRPARVRRGLEPRDGYHPAD